MKKTKFTQIFLVGLLALSVVNSGNIVNVASNATSNTTSKVANNTNKPSKITKQLLTGDKFNSKTVKVFIEPKNPVGIQQDIQWAVKDWSQATNHVKFEIEHDRNVANVRFTTGQISYFRNALTFQDQTTPNGNHVLIDRAVVKIDPQNFDQTKVSNFGIRVASHEIGHVLGLADVKNTNLKYSTIMWYHDPAVGITQNDINAINYLY